jgi:hypothetical protein
MSVCIPSSSPIFWRDFAVCFCSFFTLRSTPRSIAFVFRVTLLIFLCLSLTYVAHDHRIASSVQAFGRVDFRDVLRTDSTSSTNELDKTTTTTSRFSCFSDLTKTTFSDSQLEATRQALLQTRRAITACDSGGWRPALESVGLDAEVWVRDLRSVLNELVRLATDKVGDGDAYYSSVEALQRQHLQASLQGHS